MAHQLGPHDQVIAEIASRQYGVVAATQLRAVGVEPHHIATRVRRGWLHVVHRGVYAVGHPGLDQKGRWMAAVLACGDGAVLSHASAAALWNLIRPIKGSPVHVSIRSRSGRSRGQEIRIHRPRSLTSADLTRCSDIPVTSVSRTLLDLDGTVEPRLYRRAVREAQKRRIKLDPRIRADRTRSDLEGDFLAFCRRHRIPPPEVNLRVGKPTVDFVWPALRLAVETDSYEYHHGEVAFEDDHARDLYLRRRGLTVLRYTGRQLEEEEALVLEDLRRYIPVMKGLG
jgi:very-short-patch-repair endonuclease